MIGKELAAIERRLDRLHQQAATIETAMIEDSSDYAKLTEHNRALQDVRQQQAELEEKWLELSVQVD